MPRPLYGTAPRIKVSVTLAPDLVAAIDELAAKHHKSRSQLISIALAETIFTNARQELAEHVSAKIENLVGPTPEQPADTCPHPRDQRQRFSWGSKCTHCQAVLPGVQ